MSIRVRTPEFRLSYPNLFEPRQGKLDKQPMYSAVLLFPLGADLTEMKHACKRAMQEKFGDNPSDWPAEYRKPFKDQLEEKKSKKTGEMVKQLGHVNGAKFLNVKTKNKIPIVNQTKLAITDPLEVYAGCWCKAALSVYAYDQGGNTGVNFGLEAIQKVRDDEGFGSRVDPEKFFEPVVDVDDLEVKEDGDANDF